MKENGDPDYLRLSVARMKKVFFVSVGESPTDPVKGVPIRDFVFLLCSFAAV
jgi:hypothetical protein